MPDTKPHLIEDMLRKRGREKLRNTLHAAKQPLVNLLAGNEAYRACEGLRDEAGKPVNGTYVLSMLVESMLDVLTERYEREEINDWIERVDRMQAEIDELRSSVESSE